MAATIHGAEGWEIGFNNGVEVRTFAEQNTLEIEATGSLSTLLTSQPTQGSFISGAAYGHNPAEGYGWGVKSSSVTGDGGGVATLRVSLVALKSASDAYDISYDVDLSEVQMSLKKHPSLTAEDISIIQQWEATPEAVRVYGDGASFGFRYYEMSSADATPGALTKVSATSGAWNYLYAVASGIETYNIYLPVITRTAHYLKMDISSSIVGYSTLGTFDTPPITLSGYTGDKNWFKSADKLTRANDGTVTRTEQWTYTNDTTHSWIYE